MPDNSPKLIALKNPADCDADLPASIERVDVVVLVHAAAGDFPGYPSVCHAVGANGCGKRLGPERIDRKGRALAVAIRLGQRLPNTGRKDESKHRPTYRPTYVQIFFEIHGFSSDNRSGWYGFTI